MSIVWTFRIILVATHSLDNLTRCISLDEARGREAVGKGFPAHGYRRTIHPTYREASWPNEPVAGKSFQRQDGQVCLLRREEKRRGEGGAWRLIYILSRRLLPGLLSFLLFIPFTVVQLLACFCFFYFRLFLRLLYILHTGWPFPFPTKVPT